jgi:hypothetical protein
LIASLLCKNTIPDRFSFALTAEQADFSRERHGRVGRMSIAVPIILAVALATSLYGQAGTIWPNYESEQKDKSDKGDDDSSKDKSGGSDKKSSEKGKSAQKETSGKSVKRSTPAASGGSQDARPKRQE